MATVLVAEDDTSLSRLLRVVLDYHGYQTLEARSGDEALHCLGVHTLDLLIVDLNLGTDDGAAIARIARAERPGLPVIFISGMSEASLRRDKRLGEGDFFLAKPFSIVQLRSAMARLLGDPLGAKSLAPTSWHIPCAPETARTGSNGAYA